MNIDTFIEKTNDNIFVNIPGYGLIIDKKGTILSITDDLKELLKVQPNLGEDSICDLFKDLCTQCDFDTLLKKRVIEYWYTPNIFEKICFQFTFKEVVTKNQEPLIIVWMKNKTKSKKYDKVRRILANLAKSEIEIKDNILFYKSIQEELNHVIDANNLFVVQFDKYKQHLILTFMDDEMDKLHTVSIRQNIE